MDLHNELKLRFDDPIWAYSPELALFDIFLEKHPEIVREVGKDVLKNNGKGRQDSPSVETVLRAAIYMSVEKLTYRDLEKDMYDSKVCFHFLRLEDDHYYSFSVMCFEIQRVLWHGFEKFCAKIAWSVLGYNLRVITNRILE